VTSEGDRQNPIAGRQFNKVNNSLIVNRGQAESAVALGDAFTSLESLDKRQHKYEKYNNGSNDLRR
jgi:hypothetical protein